MLATLCAIETMRIILSNSSEISILSVRDLAKIIPPVVDGCVLNYGQGEGKIALEDNVWGIYCHSDRGNHVLQFEEGTLDLEGLQRITTILLSHIRDLYGPKIEFIVEGCLENCPPHEKYT